MRVVSRRLGHSDVQTTMNTYAPVTEDAELRAVADWAKLRSLSSEPWPTSRPSSESPTLTMNTSSAVMSAEAAKIVTSSCR